MSLCLLMDSSLQGVQVAIIDPNASAPSGHKEPLRIKNCLDVMGSAKLLSVLVNEALSEKNNNIDMLDAIVLSTGPGSFTGIRIGLAFTYGLRATRANGLKIMAVSSLAICAEALYLEAPGSLIALFLPATKTAGYLAIRGQHQEDLLAIDCESSLGRTTIKSLMEHGINLRIFSLNWPFLDQFLNQESCIFKKLSFSDISRMAMLQMAKMATISWPDGFSDTLPEPIFLKKSTAEERLRE